MASAELLDIEAGYHQSGDNRKALSRLLKIVRIHPIFRNRRVKARLLNDLAGVSAKLRLYPIAMKCYYNAAYTTALSDSAETDSNTAPLDSNFYQELASLDSALPSARFEQAVIESEPIQTDTILSSFNDGKPAASYAMLVHVKQPVPGRRKAFTHINNVGHMFITLIKYNKDNSFVCRSFGFYPNKANLLSGTPFHPESPSTFKDDSKHDWDEVAGKFISPRRFRRILEVLQSYEQRSYHLNENNCTDFGLTISAIGGISIKDTRGHWPLGKGNNPANAGQSMHEGKVSNVDQEYPAPLFVSSYDFLHDDE